MAVIAANTKKEVHGILTGSKMPHSYSYCSMCGRYGKISKGLCKKCTHKSDFHKPKFP